jgi:hypothetical protein
MKKHWIQWGIIGGIVVCILLISNFFFFSKQRVFKVVGIDFCIAPPHDEAIPINCLDTIYQPNEYRFIVNLKWSGSPSWGGSHSIQDDTIVYLGVNGFDGKKYYSHEQKLKSRKLNEMEWVWRESEDGLEMFDSLNSFKTLFNETSGGNRDFYPGMFRNIGWIWKVDSLKTMQHSITIQLTFSSGKSFTKSKHLWIKQ